MILQSNGEALETGRMVNPETGIEEDYEECWVDIEPKVVDREGEYRSWVLRCEGEGTGIRGVIVRVGVFIQAALRKGEDFSLGRWMWSEGKGWEKIVSIGNLEVPSGAFEGDELLLRQKVKGEDGLEWDCVESFSWP